MIDEMSVSISSLSVRSLLIALCITGSAWLAFEWAASRHVDGRNGYERSWVEGLRDPRDPAHMIGSPLLEESVRDYSALGGYAVVSSIIVVFTIFGGLCYGRSYVRFFLLTVLGGYGCSMLLKLAFGRDRPSVVPHLSHVATTSFPSSHAMVSSIVYLTIGLLLAQRIRDPQTRSLFVLVPLCLTAVIGFSRVAMGVHYPTDVLAGWTAGLTWTIMAFRIQPLISSPVRIGASLADQR
jgi:undecaprenyl-diphosphatase